MLRLSILQGGLVSSCGLRNDGLERTWIVSLNYCIYFGFIQRYPLNAIIIYFSLGGPDCSLSV